MKNLGILLFLATVLSLPCFICSVNAEIYNWQTGEMIYGTENITPEPGVDLSGWVGFMYPFRSLQYADLANADLTSAKFNYSDLDFALFINSNLTNADLTSTTHFNTDFANANLTNANFDRAHFVNANFSNAIVKGAYFRGAASRGFTNSNLYSTKSYLDKDLSGINLGANNLRDWNFSGQNLTNADLSNSDLRGTNITNANLTNSKVNSANLDGAVSFGFTKEQLYSTQSYKDRNLSGGIASYSKTNFSNNNLTNWDFTGQNLTHTYFHNSTVTNANFTLADLRESEMFTSVGQVIYRNTIDERGYIESLNLLEDEVLQIANYDFNTDIHIFNQMKIDNSGGLKFIFNEDNWYSTVNIESGTIINLAGTLELDFADDVDISSLIGTTFDLFDWNGLLTENDIFDNITFVGNTEWDLSNLYTTGEVTLIPEPVTLFLFGLGGLMLRKKSS